MMNKEVCHVVTTLQALQTAQKLFLVNADGIRVADLVVKKCSVQPILQFSDYLK